MYSKSETRTLMSDEIMAVETQPGHDHMCNCKILNSASESLIFRCVAAHEKFPGTQCSLSPKQLETSDLAAVYI